MARLLALLGAAVIAADGEAALPGHCAPAANEACGSGDHSLLQVSKQIPFHKGSSKHKGPRTPRGVEQSRDHKPMGLMELWAWSADGKPEDNRTVVELTSAIDTALTDLELTSKLLTYGQHKLCASEEKDSRRIKTLMAMLKVQSLLQGAAIERKAGKEGPQPSQWPLDDFPSETTAMTESFETISSDVNSEVRFVEKIMDAIAAQKDRNEVIASDISERVRSLNSLLTMETQECRANGQYEEPKDPPPVEEVGIAAPVEPAEAAVIPPPAEPAEVVVVPPTGSTPAEVVVVPPPVAPAAPVAAAAVVVPPPVAPAAPVAAAAPVAPVSQAQRSQAEKADEQKQASAENDGEQIQDVDPDEESPALAAFAEKTDEQIHDLNPDLTDEKIQDVDPDQPQDERESKTSKEAKKGKAPTATLAEEAVKEGEDPMPLALLAEDSRPKPEPEAASLSESASFSDTERLDLMMNMQIPPDLAVGRNFSLKGIFARMKNDTSVLEKAVAALVERKNRLGVADDKSGERLENMDKDLGLEEGDKVSGALVSGASALLQTGQTNSGPGGAKMKKSVKKKKSVAEQMDQTDMLKAKLMEEEVRDRERTKLRDEISIKEATAKLTSVANNTVENVTESIDNQISSLEKDVDAITRRKHMVCVAANQFFDRMTGVVDILKTVEC